MNDFTKKELEILSTLNTRKVRVIKFTGTIKSANEMKLNLKNKVVNIYEDMDSINKFIVETSDGVRYFSGDYYIVDVNHE